MPQVSNPGWIPRLHALLHSCNVFLTFTSGVTPVDLLVTSMMTKPFLIHIDLLVSIQALVGLGFGINCVVTSQDMAGHMPNQNEISLSNHRSNFS